ncbi:hypothetical protein P618_200949 [Holospora obtusa F1]|uniref:Uncharacterized protein n=1 Tax=Holospora obtusa F1 TaxID=1399147 RepID=W6TD68_HOLOB|nr:hypothetical protein [Holospora obtusa]ETZ06878.1 hypothetical protein P618_200949 [Holospora obtusa F1]
MAVVRIYDIYVSTILLPLSTTIILWTSRPITLLQHYKIAFWTCGFSCIWCGYWMFASPLYAFSGTLIFLYIFFLMYLIMYRNRMNQERKLLPLVRMFFQYSLITGILITTSFYLKWTLMCAIFLSLAYGMDPKKLRVWGVLMLCSGMFKETLSFFCGIMYSFFSFLQKSKGFSVGSSSQHLHWIQWISGVLYIILPKIQTSLKGIYVQESVFLFLMGMIFVKKQYVYSRFLVYMQSIQWIKDDLIVFSMTYLGCMQWAHYMLYQDQEICMTKNFAKICNGILLGSCCGAALWGIMCIMHTSKYFYVYCGELILYVLCCLMYSQSIYLKLHNRKYKKHTLIEVYVIFAGVLIWNVFNGYYLGKNNLF